MIRKKPAVGLDPRVATGFPKSMPSGLTRGIMLQQRASISETIDFEPKSPLPGNGIFRAETKRPKRLPRFRDAGAETNSR
jgi:hypothetical protein